MRSVEERKVRAKIYIAPDQLKRERERERERVRESTKDTCTLWFHTKMGELVVEPGGRQLHTIGIFLMATCVCVLLSFAEQTTPYAPVPMTAIGVYLHPTTHSQ